VSKARRSVDIYDADAVEQLIRRIRRNPKRHQEEFYQLFWDDAYRFAYGILNNRQDAEDVAQTALIRAYERLDTLKEPRAALKWVHRIVGNAALDYHRSESRRVAGFEHADTDISDIEAYTSPITTSSNELTPAHAADARYLPDELVMRKEVNRIVYGLIEALPAKQRQAIMLYYYAGFSVSEIAEDMDSSNNAVKALLFRARDTLNVRIQETEKTENIRLYSVNILPLAQVLQEVARNEIIPPAPPMDALKASSLSNADGVESVSQSTKINGYQITAISIATALVVLAGAVFAINGRTSHEELPLTSTTSVSRDDNDKTEEEKDILPQPPLEDNSPDSSSSGSGSDNPSPVAPTPPPQTGNTNEDEIIIEIVPSPPPIQPVPPVEYPRLPEVGSVLRFGTLGGAPIMWRVTDRTLTALTITALQDTPSLQGAFSSAEQAAIVSSSNDLRPIVKLDGSMLDFVLRGNYVYAEAR